MFTEDYAPAGKRSGFRAQAETQHVTTRSKAQIELRGRMRQDDTLEFYRLQPHEARQHFEQFASDLDYPFDLGNAWHYRDAGEMACEDAQIGRRFFRVSARACSSNL